ISDPGASDPTFYADFINKTMEKVLIEPDGHVIFGGWFTLVQELPSFDVFTRRGIARFSSSGDFDASFGDGEGVTGTSNPRVLDIVRQPDGKFIICGEFTSVHGVARSRIARLNTDGTLDTSFNP